MRRQIYTLPNATQSASGGGEVTQSVFIPAGYQGSLELDIALSADKSAGAGIALRARGSTTWSGGVNVAGLDSSGGSVTKHVRIALGGSVPITQDTEIELRCTPYLWTFGNASCTWTNLTVYQDVPGWQPGQTDNLPALTTQWGVENTWQGLPTSNGPFLGIKVDGGFGGPYWHTYTYKSPIVQLPSSAVGENAIFTMSMAWSRSTPTDDNAGGASGIVLDFVPLDPTVSGAPIIQIAGVANLNAIPWAVATGTVDII